MANSSFSLDQRILGGDGASLSSIGSSCSPPLVSEDSTEMLLDAGHRISRHDGQVSSVQAVGRRPSTGLNISLFFCMERFDFYFFNKSGMVLEVGIIYHLSTVLRSSSELYKN